ncbi:MAG: DNA mismatch repair endonuclease MutL [Phycisphaerae bacterium]|nr:DNA mismatch repair endonuclease MutL [Phycisphaerae bacterium]
MSQIRKLPPALVNKIAAGEVIERPASVVKELIENALDAGATRIDVALEEGGTRLIRVSDNGHGIPRDDLPLAVAPHATSKIYTDEDLFNIRSLGFRGEALASIASVSHLRICSRPAVQLEAYELTAADGTAEPPKACAAPVGTTVEIRNLFYSVPARRKFLRRPPTEFSHATEQFARLALAHPDIAFTLSHNGRTTRNLPAAGETSKRQNVETSRPAAHDRSASIANRQSLASRRARIGDFYGTELAECLIAIDCEERGLRIEALIAPPDQSRASTKWQYVFLNGRFISDRRIGYAAREAFRGLVEHDRFPVVFIFLTTSPDQFDVNVHPTKIEVRWRDAGLIQSQVLAAIRETLLTHNLTPRLRTPADGYPHFPIRNPQSAIHDSPTQTDLPSQQGVRQAVADYLKSIDPTQARIEFRPPPFPTQNMRPSIANTYASPRQSASTDHAQQPPPGGPNLGPGVSSMDQLSDPTDHNDAARAQEVSGISPQAPNIEPQASHFPNDPGRCVIQIHNTYIVAQTDEGVIIVDQHALHERILYEKFRERILAGPLESQRLLIPQTIEVPPQQAQAAEQHQDLLRGLGIEISTFGAGTLAVQSFPTLLHSVDINSFVVDLFDRLAESGHAESEETLVHAVLDMMACKAAVKAGDPLSTEEMEALLAQRHLTEKHSNCPHGRPTTLQLSTRDLEKQFRRI